VEYIEVLRVAAQTLLNKLQAVLLILAIIYICTLSLIVVVCLLYIWLVDWSFSCIVLSSSSDHLGLVLVCISGACIMLSFHRPSTMDDLKFCYLMSSYMMMVQGVLEVFSPLYDAEDHMLMD
jgi:hypothetical protein